MDVEIMKHTACVCMSNDVRLGCTDRWSVSVHIVRPNEMILILGIVRDTI